MSFRSYLNFFLVSNILSKHCTFYFTFFFFFFFLQEAKNIGFRNIIIIEGCWYK